MKNIFWFILILYELINKLKWHNEYDFNKVIIWYISRGAPEGKDYIKGNEIKRVGKKFLETANKYIPYHRILKIEYEGKIIFRK